MKLKVFIAVLFLITLNSCLSSKTISNQPKMENAITEISSITNKAPYDPRPGMTELRKENERKESNGKVKLQKPMHFLVFGDSKGREVFNTFFHRFKFL